MSFRIMHVVPSLEGGGAERVVSSLAAEQKRRGNEVLLVRFYPEAAPDILESIGRSGVRTIVLHKRKGLDLSIARKLGRIIAEFGPDVVNSHQYTLKYLSPSIAKFGKSGTAFFHTFHTLAENEAGPLARRLNERCFRKGVRAISIADAVSGSIRKVYGEKIAVEFAENGIATKAIESDARGKVRKELGIEDDDMMIINVAGFRKEKNHGVLVRAYARVAGKHEKSCLVLAGDGELFGEMKELARRLGIGARVKMLGYRTDIPELLAASDIFVLPSAYEGNPLSLMEAMNYGVPVIAHNVGGIPQILGGGRYGMVYDDDGELAGALCAMCEDKGMRAGLARSAAEKSKDFSISTMADKYERIYDKRRGDGKSTGIRNTTRRER